MDNFRNMVFIKNGLGENLVKVQYSEEDFNKLRDLSNDFSNQELVKILNLLQESLEKLKFASIPLLPLELVMVEVCEEKVSKKLDVRSSKLDPPAGGLKLDNTDQTSNIQSHDLSSNIQHPISNNDILKLKEKWQFVLETIRPYNFSLEALLRSASISECTELDVIMEVPYTFHQRILESPKNREMLESIFSDILQRQIRVSTILGIRPLRADDVVNIEVAADDEIIRAAAEIFSSDTIN
jgi:DNA polymerase III gamma/tau subunit